jgi:hypothetical protein
MNAPTTNRDPHAAQPAAWPAWAVWAASLAIVLHLAAVIVAPLAVQPSSALFGQIRWGLAWYVDPAYLNHGYHFFAPEPGPSHLIAYELELADGSTRGGVFPDRDQNRPRLFYHRHFMLSEKLLPLDADRTTYEAIVQSYANHLLSTNPDAVAVAMTYREHLIASPIEFHKGQSLNDPSLYRERKLGRFRRAAEKTS